MNPDKETQEIISASETVDAATLEIEPGRWDALPQRLRHMITRSVESGVIERRPRREPRHRA
jgi:hypothetical protein